MSELVIRNGKTVYVSGEEAKQYERAEVAERENLVQEKTEGIEVEAESRISAIPTQHSSAEDLRDLLDRWPHIEPLVMDGSDLDKTRKAAEDMERGIDELRGLPLDELRAVDPPSDDPFSDTSVNPSTWRI